MQINIRDFLTQIVGIKFPFNNKQENDKKKLINLSDKLENNDSLSFYTTFSMAK